MKVASGPERPVPRWVAATAVAGTILISVGAFWLSFTSLADLARRSGIGARQAWAWPLIVDGIIVVATISVVAMSPHGRRAIVYPWALLIAGALVSVTANAAHAVVAADAATPRPLAAAVSAVPPLVLVAITHLTVELIRRAPSTVPGMEPGSRARRQSDERVTNEGGAMSASQRRDAAWTRRRQGWSNSQIAHAMGVHPSTVGRWFSGQPDPKAAIAGVSALTGAEENNHRQENLYATRSP